MANEYASLTALKSRLNIRDEFDDALLSDALESASRMVDAMCRRRFYVTVGEVRLFTASSAYRLVMGDCIAVTALQTDEDGDRTYEITWSTTDYYLDDGAAGRWFAQGRPYYQLLVDRHNGRYSFPSTYRGVQVTGSFGFCAVADVPPLVRQATMELATNIYRLKDTIGGRSGGTEWADPTRIYISGTNVRTLLQDYVLEDVGDGGLS